MPKNPLKFGRRKSSPLIFDDASTPTPAVSSFRVLERPDKINLNGDQRPATAVRPVTRPFDSPIAHLRAVSTDRLDVSPSRSVHSTASAHDWTLKSGRASGGTFRSGSSGIYESSSASARHSSTSTLPSSIDAEKEQEDEELFSRKARPTSTFHDVPLNDDELLSQPPSFTDRAVQAMSLAQKHSRAQSTPHFVPTPPTRPKNAARSPERHSSPRRERAMTTSSYASTAKPDGYVEITSPDANEGFDSLVNTSKSGDRWDGPLPPLPPAAAYHRTDSPPIFHTRAQSQSPYRSSPDIPREDTDSPYAWDRRGSTDRLMPGSPSHSPDLTAPPPPPHRTSTLFGQSHDGYAKVPDRYSSPRLDGSSSVSQDGFLPDRGPMGEGAYGNHSHVESGYRFEHQNLPILSKSNDAPNRTSTFGYADSQQYPSRSQADGQRHAAKADAVEEDESLFPSGSRNATPRAARTAITRQQSDTPLDSSPLGPPSRAVRPSSYRNGSNTPKRMTKEQFERLQRRRDSNAEESDEDDLRSEGDETEENDAERAKRVAKQRQRQEANMSVYRQQMKKVTGGASADAASTLRPGFDRSPASSPAPGSGSASVHLGGMGGTSPPESSRGKQSDDDEDDDVPLGILQAHGFPHSSRPASASSDKDPSIQRRPSPAESVTGRGGSPANLPPFARRLPADPYFGAGLVHHPNRESIGLNGTPSVYGGVAPSLPSQGASIGHPGGLVGVIAGEERARASRRGSPNPVTGTFGPAQVPMGMSSSRSVSMGNMIPPQAHFPNGMAPVPMMGMPQMPMISDPQQQEQMQQFMQMQMQFMQNMMALQQQQQQPPEMGQMAAVPSQPSPDFLAVPTGHSKRHSTSSAASQAPSITRSSRAMSALSPPSNWNVPAGGKRQSSYAPSGLNIPVSGPVPSYTPSIAPTERSNVGMPSRYRPVHVSSDSSLRTTSMASAAQASNTASDTEKPQPKATIRAIDKPKGTPRAANKAPSTTSEEDDDGWAEMMKKREEKKSKFRFGKKGKEFTMEELVHELR